MKWENYKLLTKDEREEYQYKFGDGKDGMIFGGGCYLGILGFIMTTAMLAMIAKQQGINITMFVDFIIVPMKILTMFVILDVFYIICISMIKLKWIKQHLKIVHK